MKIPLVACFGWLLLFATSGWAHDSLRGLLCAEGEPIPECRHILVWEEWGRLRVEVIPRPEDDEIPLLRIPPEYRRALLYALDAPRLIMSVPDGVGGRRNLLLRYLVARLSPDRSTIARIDGGFVGFGPSHTNPIENTGGALPRARMEDLLDARPPWKPGAVLTGVPLYFEDRRVYEVEMLSTDIGYESYVRGLVERTGRTGLLVADLSIKERDLARLGRRLAPTVFKGLPDCIRAIFGPVPSFGTLSLVPEASR